MAALNDTPRANRVHIAFFGKTNAGKSSTVNAITGGGAALVSDIAGTTADPVYKAMELPQAGPVVLVDTAGLDDETALGRARIQKTEEAAEKTDIAVMVIRADDADTRICRRYAALLEKQGVPVLTAYNVFGETVPEAAVADPKAVVFSARTGEVLDVLINRIIAHVPDAGEPALMRGVAQEGDVVLLVMPQDGGAPKGRLILPQAQAVRGLLDNGCIAVCVKPEELAAALQKLKGPPALVITDSQVFAAVDAQLDPAVPLTSFSILMARQKGDIKTFVEGARAIAALKPGDKVLLMESCAHHAQKGDIAREKLPGWLDGYAGGGLRYTVRAGQGFPADLREYKLVVHCGACMGNRREMLSKIAAAKEAGVPITNFGVAIAFLNGILERVTV